MKRLMWLIPLVIIGVIAGLLGASAISTSLKPAPPIDTASESRNTQVINAIKKIDEVALVSLGIQGIVEKTQTTTIFGLEIPGSGRALFLQYAFTAKLGMDGGRVDIEPGDNGDEFIISIPEFIFIGHDDVEFKLAVENNGVLSWLTPEIDEFGVVNEILNDDSKQEYLKSNGDTLRAQAKSFYTSIVKGIDPKMDLDFDFDSDGGR